MPVETPSLFAQVIKDHLELKERNSGLDRQMPIDRYRADDPSAPGILPQIVVAAEQYNRLIRMGEAGVDVKLEVALDVSFSKPDSGHNVIAEIPGTDLKDEVVMIGAHLDSWHGGTGATDDGTGVAACMEAMRILKTLGLHPRRTIRIALWGGEEQGLLGSKGYVKQHFGELRTASERSPAKIDLKPDAILGGSSSTWDWIPR